MNTLAKPLALSAAPAMRRATAPPHWLAHLGALGVFSVAVVDSSVVPLLVPGSTDLLLLWLVAHGGDPWLLAAGAVAGSLLGGYSTWQLGRKGGESTLQRHVPVRFLGRIAGWVESHPVLAVFLPAVLPPPVPLSPFVLAAGALGVSRNRFLAVFGAARSLRYSIIAWLAVLYGRKVIRMWSGAIQVWSTPLLLSFAAVFVIGVCFGIWKLRRPRKSYATNLVRPSSVLAPSPPPITRSQHCSDRNG
jgi:membrane protein YqaA with SNARE-associated domain